jgi:hypothetical protein
MEPEPRAPDPRRIVVVSYDSYAEAQRAVDHLSDGGFPVDRVAIVAEDLRIVEQVTGRMGYGRAALQGAGLGALIGVIIGFFLGSFSSYIAILWLIYGAVIGLIVGLGTHALSGGRRDFSSIEGIQAGRYNVTADEEVAEEASSLLARLRVPPEDARGESALERTGRAREEAESSGGEEVPADTRNPEGVSLREDPSSEEGLERQGTVPPTGDSPEAPPSGKERPHGPTEERSPRGSEEPPPQ